MTEPEPLLMARDIIHIQSSPSGEPYILESEPVSVVTRPYSPSSSSSSSSSFCYIDPPTPPPRRTPLAAFFSRKKNGITTPETTEPPPPPPKHNTREPHGIFIQFPPEHAQPHLSRKQRLVHLQQTISIAVRDAGMRCSPGNTPQSSANDPPHLSQGHTSPDALFCGTYGQMMAALQGAGLSATLCVGEHPSRHMARLGALFVARDGGASGVQLRKITLWG